MALHPSVSALRLYFATIAQYQRIEGAKILMVGKWTRFFNTTMVAMGHQPFRLMVAGPAPLDMTTLATVIGVVHVAVPTYPANWIFSYPEKKGDLSVLLHHSCGKIQYRAASGSCN